MHDSDFANTMKMVTSHGRSLYYGPHSLVYSRTVDMTTFRSNDKQQIVGLFIDPTSACPSKIQSIGVAMDHQEKLGISNPQELTLPAIEGADSSLFAVQHFRSAFMSTASMTNIKNIKTQTRGERCVGLYIEHHCGVPDTLGQWDPGLLDATTDLYHDDGHTTPIDALTFVFSSEPKPTDRHCIRIILGRDESISSPTFICDNFSSVSDSSRYTLRW